MPSVEFKFKGLIVPVFTPFNEDDGQTINLSIIPRYADYLAKKGITATLVGSTTGEGTSLTFEERKAITEEWVKAVKVTKQHLMVQVGGAPPPLVIELAKHAEALKVDSIICQPDLYFKPSNNEELISYLKMVSDAAPKTPLLYYHNPPFTHVNINMGQFLESVGEQIPTFVGIKYYGHDFEDAFQAMRADNGRFVVFLGNDELILPSCTMGSELFILTGANVFPELVLSILSAWKKRDFETAKKQQELYSKAYTLMEKYGLWILTMKYAMRFVASLNVGCPRLPVKYLSPEKESLMKNDLLSQILKNM